MRWYESKIGNGKKEYFDYVDVVINYIEQRFDNLSKIINNYYQDLIIYNECIVTWTNNCQKFLCEEILKKDQARDCFEYFLSDVNRGKGSHICLENINSNSDKACKEVSKYRQLNPLNEDPSAIILIFIIINNFNYKGFYFFILDYTYFLNYGKFFNQSSISLELIIIIYMI